MSTKISRPGAIADLLPETDPTDPAKHPCEGADHHSPRPLVTHGYRLPNGVNFWLCGTCKDNVQMYVNLWERHKGLEWRVQRCFGNQTRLIATLVLQAPKNNH